jgi:hypothetical protein
VHASAAPCSCCPGRCSCQCHALEALDAGDGKSLVDYLPHGPRFAHEPANKCGYGPVGVQVPLSHCGRASANMWVWVPDLPVLVRARKRASASLRGLEAALAASVCCECVGLWVCVRDSRDCECECRSPVRVHTAYCHSSHTTAV